MTTREQNGGTEDRMVAAVEREVARRRRLLLLYWLLFLIPAAVGVLILLYGRIDVAKLTEERDRLRRELQRAHALVRVVQRGLGLPDAEKQRTTRNKRRKAAGKKRERKPVVRARKAIARLRADSEQEGSAGQSAPAGPQKRRE